MLIKSNFQADSGKKEIIPMSQSGMSYICMYADAGNLLNGSFPWHWHSAFEIDYLESGQMEFHTTAGSFTMHKGDAVFVNSGVLHAYSTHNPKDFRVTAHIFYSHFLAGSFNDAIDQKYIRPIMQSNDLQTFLIRPDNLNNIDMLGNILRMIDLTQKEPFGYEFSIRSELSSFWCTLLKETKELRSKNTLRDSVDINRMKAMTQYVQEHYSERITLEDIASSANISGRESTRCFQRCIDNTPINYLNDYRIRMAAQMLLQSEATITTISENCGFSSISYFGKVFHEKMGRTPLEFRKVGVDG